MTNPYEPVGTETPPSPSPVSVHFYRGGFLAVATASIVIGAIVGASLFSFPWQTPFPAFAIAAIGWLIAIGLLTFLIRTAKFSYSGRVLLALLLLIPAYILYVPVCGVVSMSTTLFLGGKDYGPTTGGAIIGSAVAFFMILMTIAAIVRVVFRKRERAHHPSSDEQV